MKDLKEGREFSEYVQQNKLSKLSPYATQVLSSEKVTFYDRYISKMVFSKDEKFIAYILKNGLRQWYLYVFDFTDIKPRKFLETKYTEEIVEINFFPNDSKQLLVAGENRFELLFISKGQSPEREDLLPSIRAAFRADDVSHSFSASNASREQVFTSSLFTSCNMLIGISNIGDVIIFERMEVVQTFSKFELASKGSQNRDHRLDLRHLVECRFGFIVASLDVIYFFKRNEKESAQRFSLILKWRCPEFFETRITSLSVCEGDESSPQEQSNLAISTKNNQIIYLNLYRQVFFPDSQQIGKEFMQDVSKYVQDADSDQSEENAPSETTCKAKGIEEEENTKAQSKSSKKKEKDRERMDNEALIERIEYKVVAGGFHQGNVSVIDVCIQRPILVSMSKQDNTIRVWNYHTGNCEIIQDYTKNVKYIFSNSTSEHHTVLQSVAIHPMGFYLAIAQIDKVKVVHIMDSEFRDYREIDIKNCKQVKFSNGGHLLTCVDNKDINVFNFFNYSRPHKMQSPSGKVTDLCFNHDDTVMTVVTEDGFIQKYDLVKFIKTGENFINKKFKF